MKTRQRTKTGAALVLFVLAVVTCGRLHADEAEDRAVKAIERLGGEIFRDGNVLGSQEMDRPTGPRGLSE
jgi:hypothetical protein